VNDKSGLEEPLAHTRSGQSERLRARSLGKPVASFLTSLAKRLRDKNSVIVVERRGESAANASDAVKSEIGSAGAMDDDICQRIDFLACLFGDDRPLP